MKKTKWIEELEDSCWSTQGCNIQPTVYGKELHSLLAFPVSSTSRHLSSFARQNGLKSLVRNNVKAVRNNVKSVRNNVKSVRNNVKSRRNDVKLSSIQQLSSLSPSEVTHYPGQHVGRHQSFFTQAIIDPRARFTLPSAHRPPPKFFNHPVRGTAPNIQRSPFVASLKRRPFSSKSPLVRYYGSQPGISASGLRLDTTLTARRVVGSRTLVASPARRPVGGFNRQGLRVVGVGKIARNGGGGKSKWTFHRMKFTAWNVGSANLKRELIWFFEQIIQIILLQFLNIFEFCKKLYITTYQEMMKTIFLKKRRIAPLIHNNAVSSFTHLVILLRRAAWRTLLFMKIFAFFHYVEYSYTYTRDSIQFPILQNISQQTKKGITVNYPAFWYSFVPLFQISSLDQPVKLYTNLTTHMVLSPSLAPSLTEVSQYTFSYKKLRIGVSPPVSLSPILLKFKEK